ncbi:pseudouridine-5'-phosphate glycosidase [Deinococcus cellulosilyticus]|uniref:Pseudouridine-5'-phosphate glycosidase n=1 Tax=Deinococcus cellulosilyticus (strain DSM 18568 / NBRC 106333 / KACC 11606 / 5516J-15) TaxID=1223518 RepID=A0A511N702_DEIC1|nr:pseudouridine-5'-phosphate glycosidase [Deinococcus cellulosilyticus]GEM48257.1 pseudouridine-5'-phosphate glycosidase [Deinococcus cellulosilyticus NBRC 106333 = KACC 11606]
MITLHPEVREALQAGKPVVALESTIISHGMPYPQNVQTARKVETIIREQGAIPATIAILNGDIKVGLSDEELEMLGSSKDVLKVSIRDLPYVTALKLNGATTVASTMRIAHQAGIAVFVTGGLGGVHRGAETTFDVSADLTEFTLSNVAVISAGVKSILDIGLTLEKLETLGVPVIGYGTEDFPAFYSRVSGFKVPMTLSDPADIAKVMKDKWTLQLTGGLSIANPIPAEDEIPASVIDPHIAQALQEAQENGIKGKDVTPFLLAKISEITAGQSLKSNIALVKNNARLGAQIAVAYSKL